MKLRSGTINSPVNTMLNATKMVQLFTNCECTKTSFQDASADMRSRKKVPAIVSPLDDCEPYTNLLGRQDRGTVFDWLQLCSL